MATKKTNRFLPGFGFMLVGVYASEKEKSFSKIKN